MTAQYVASEPTRIAPSQGALFLGFGNVFRKEVTEWLRGRRAIVVAIVSVLSVAFTTLVPFVVQGNRPSVVAGRHCRWIRPPTSSTAGAARRSRSSPCSRR